MSTFFSKLANKNAPLRAKATPRGDIAGGFTLMELLATVAILAFGLGAILSLQAATMKGGSLATTSTMATFLAESQLEYLRTLEFNNLAYISQNPEKLTTSGLSCEGLNPPGPCFFTRTTTLTMGFPVQNNSYAVSIKVEWSDKTLIHDAIIPGLSFN